MVAVVLSQLVASAQFASEKAQLLRLARVGESGLASLTGVACVSAAGTSHDRTRD